MSDTTLAGAIRSEKTVIGKLDSDQRIHADVRNRLVRNPILDLSDIEVIVVDGEVTLSGIVDSPQLKHLIEGLAREVSGVRKVQNDLRLRRPEAHRESISGTYSGIAERGATSDMGRIGELDISGREAVTDRTEDFSLTPKRGTTRGLLVASAIFLVGAAIGFEFGKTVGAQQRK
jgi:hypothetical protein